jgi:hypothetical protein
MLIYDTDELPHLKQVLPRRVIDVYKDKEIFRNISVRAANRTSQVQQRADDNVDQRKRLYKLIDECMPPRVRIRLFIHWISLTFSQRVSRDEMDEIIAGVTQLFESIARQSPSVNRIADSIEVQQQNTRFTQRRRHGSKYSPSDDAEKLQPIPSSKVRVAICKAHKRGRMVYGIHLTSKTNLTSCLTYRSSL